MYPPVTNPNSVCDAIERLNEGLPNYPALAARLGMARAYYVSNRKDKKPLFGFSRFVGHEGMTPKKYIEEYGSRKDRNTEHALSRWFEELRFGSEPYRVMHKDLAEWLAQYGKRPRKKVRIMVLRPEFQETSGF